MTAHAVDWAQAGQIPANNAAREEALALDNVYMQKLSVWAEQLPYVAYMKSTPKLLEVMPRIAANVEGAILGEWSVEDALSRPRKRSTTSSPTRSNGAPRGRGKDPGRARRS